MTKKMSQSTNIGRFIKIFCSAIDFGPTLAHHLTNFAQREKIKTVGSQRAVSTQISRILNWSLLLFFFFWGGGWGYHFACYNNGYVSFLSIEKTSVREPAVRVQSFQLKLFLHPFLFLGDLKSLMVTVSQFILYYSYSSVSCSYWFFSFQSSPLKLQTCWFLLRGSFEIISCVFYHQIPPLSDAISVIKQAGASCFMAKTDVKSAFRIIPIHPSDFPATGYEMGQPILFWSLSCYGFIVLLCHFWSFQYFPRMGFYEPARRFRRVTYFRWLPFHC